MSGGGWVRPVHRWVSVVFTLTVVVNFGSLAVVGTSPAWVTYAPLVPLALLLLTGSYLFVRPYVVKGRPGLVR